MTDRIDITGIKVQAHHGVFSAERAEGQPFIVDLSLIGALEPAAHADDLSSTVDYGDVAQRVHDLVAGERHNLIETVAEEVAALALEYDGVDRVVVTIHKPEAPIAVPFDDVSVTVERAR